MRRGGERPRLTDGARGRDAGRDRAAGSNRRRVDARLGAQAATARMVLANRNLLRLGVCFGAWVTAEFAYLVAISVLSYGRGGAGAVGLVGALRILPTAVLTPLGVTLADRFPRWRVLAGVHAFWAALMLALAATVQAPSALIWLAVAVGAIAATPFKASVNALVPQIVDRPEELVAANSVYTSVDAAGMMLGPLLAGVILAVAPVQVVFVAIAMIYGGAALITAGIRTPYRAPRRAAPAGLRRLAEPFRGLPLLASPGLRLVFSLFALQRFMLGALNVFIVLAAVSDLGLGNSGAGTLLCALGVGGLAGAVMTFGVSRGLHVGLPFAAGMAMWGVPLLVAAAWLRLPVVWPALAAVGVGKATASVNGYTLLQRVIPEHLMGRVFGVFWAALTLSMAVGALAAPALVSAFSLRGAMAVTGGAVLVVVLLSLPGLRHVDAQMAVPERELELLGTVPMLAPLSGVVLERLARAVRPEEVAPGVAVVRQGEPGDLFYAVERGRLAVTVDGRFVRELGPGDCFGEIALLRQVPRTATVSTLEQTRLLALDAASFIGAVTGHVESDAVAQQTAAERLVASDA